MTKMAVPQEAAALPVVEKNGESNKAELDIEGKDPLKDFTPSPQADPAVLKKALLKMDFLVVVPLATMYSMVFIDRTNIGSAQLAGMGRSLSLVSNQFNIALMLFYIPYILTEIPVMIVGKRYGFARMIPLLTFFTGIFCMCTGFVHNAGQLYGTRFLLGLAEGGVLPAVSFFISRFYNRHQLTFRLGLFQGLCSFGGCAAALIASAILKINHIGWLTSWRNIFFLEGLFTSLIGVLGFFILVEGPGGAWYLNAAEKDAVLLSLREGQPEAAKIDDKMRKAGVRRGLLNIQTWISGAIFFFINIAVQGVAVFLPLIVGNLFPTRTVIVKQALSTPPLIFGGIVKIVCSWLSDRFDTRSTFMMAFALSAVVGFALQLSHVANPAKYFATFLMVAGTQSFGNYSPAWLAVNIGPDTTRATAVGTLMTIGNIGGLVSAWTYISTQAPTYTAGNAINVAGLTLVAILVLGLRIWFQVQNKRREQGHGMPIENLSQEEVQLLGDRHPDFRYQL